MKIVFLGTPEFAVQSLNLLLKNGYEIVGVVTAPDKPAGRGQQLQSSAVKQFAVEHGLRVLQPLKLKDPEFLRELKSLGADLQFVVAFRMLPEDVWNMPPLGTYNLHASLLPKYRGAAPINWAIMRGEKESGVTTFKLKHDIDTGNILFQERVPIGDSMTAGELHDVLMDTGALLVLKTAQELQRCLAEGREPRFLEQDETQVSHAPKLFKETCRINWTHNAEQIHNQIRGLSPYPGAFTTLVSANGVRRTVKVFFSSYKTQAHSFSNGSLRTDSKTFIEVACADGAVQLLDLQMEGKRRLPVAEFLKGHRFTEGDFFGSA